jgi:signal transduction histidine kinase
MMQAIVVETTRLERLVNDLLTYARPRPPERRPMDLRDTISEVLALAQPTADAAGVKVRMIADEPLPPLLADREQMKQLFANLVLNGLQAMPNGGTLTVAARVKKRGLGEEADNWVEVSAEDTGPGIPEADLPRIFEPFYTTRSKGTGLGLAICRQILDTHGGTIRVATTGPQGTAIEVRIPLETSPHG